MTLAELVKESYETSVSKGWHNSERNVGEILMLIVSELSEALEDARLGNAYDVVAYEDDGKPIGFATEIADTFIRLADLCGLYKIDIEEVIKIKMKYNKTRSFKHGGKKF